MCANSCSDPVLLLDAARIHVFVATAKNPALVASPLPCVATRNHSCAVTRNNTQLAAEAIAANTQVPLRRTKSARWIEIPWSAAIARTRSVFPTCAMEVAARAARRAGWPALENPQSRSGRDDPLAQQRSTPSARAGP